MIGRRLLKAIQAVKSQTGVRIIDSQAESSSSKWYVPSLTSTRPISHRNTTNSTQVTISHPSHPDILILGAGWTSTFLLPLLKQEKISYAATTTTGRDHTLKFRFEFDEQSGDLTSESKEHLAALPTAKTVLITFPLRGVGLSKALVGAYVRSRDEQQGEVKGGTQFIQLGSSGIFTPGEPTFNQNLAKTAEECWITRHSPYDKTNARAIAEDELLELGGCVLNLSGLWGGERMVKHWIDRVANTKEQLAGKKALHMIHGKDVARGIVAVHKKFESARGERFVCIPSSPTHPFDHER